MAKTGHSFRRPAPANNADAPKIRRPRRSRPPALPLRRRPVLTCSPVIVLWGGDEFGAGVVAEEVGGRGIVDADGAAANGVVIVGEGGDDVGGPGVGNEGFEVAEGFVFVGDGEAEVVGVAGEEGGVGHVGEGEGGAVGDGDGGEAAEGVVAVGDGTA